MCDDFHGTEEWEVFIASMKRVFPDRPIVEIHCCPVGLVGRWVAGRETPESVEKEITTLESQANPLDYSASEGRVRRLAMLRRQRRALADIARKKKEAQEKLDHCRQILRSMRLELVRFRSGGLNAQPTGLTMVTQQAQSVVREMGYLSEANAELNAL